MSVLLVSVLRSFCTLLCTLYSPPAYSRGHTELAGHLLDQVGKAAVDSPDDDGWTPLIIAASAGHAQLVTMLLDNGADVNKTTSQGRSGRPDLLN